MCGILAIVGGAHATLDRIRDEALDSIAHRGPDDRGTWQADEVWLGSRRLAIIDLSPGGHQPHVDPTTGVAITFNGEIYNYLELRDELTALGHDFRTKSDTEVLLHAYLQWGADLLPHLNGMWAFVLWDPRSRRAFFARDRLGVKPFYYSARSGRLIAASEPKALLVIEPGLRRVDERALYGFLAEGHLYTGQSSFYDGISVLPPGHYGTFAAGDSSAAIRRYWAPPERERRPIPYEDALKTFGDLLRDSVRLRMRSDVPVGFTLSGGLDSSSVLEAAAAVSADGKLHAFTSTFDTLPGNPVRDERRWARLVADKFDVDLQQVPADLSDWIGVLTRIVWHMDGPGYSPAVFPLWKIMERARSCRIPVLLEGQGADELLGGYTQYAALALWETLSKGRLGTLARDYGSFAKTFSVRMLTLWLIRERASFAVDAYRRRVGSLGSMDAEFSRRFQVDRRSARLPRSVNGRLRVDLTRDILPGLLQYGDAISMAHSIESRLPFLDYRLVEFVSSLPGDFKVGHGDTKRILRDHLRHVGLNAIADRRDKQGYPTPTNTWLTANGGAVLRSQLLTPDAEIHAYCRPDRMERLIDHHVSGRKGAGNHLYRLLTTQLWLQTCIGQRPDRPAPGPQIPEASFAR
jgi:asparagine synthase (glutamine-hydrolysing)